MQILSITLLLTGLFLLIYGYKFLINFINLKEIIKFNLSDQTKIFTLKKIRLYTISFVGIGEKFRIKNLHVSIKQPNGEPLQIRNNKFTYSFINKKREICLKNWSFINNQKGEHKIEFKNALKFIEETPYIKSQESIVDRQFETQKLKILITESFSVQENIFMTLSIIIGISAFIGGFLGIIYPSLFA